MKKTIPYSVYLQDEYGLKGMSIGVPALHGRNGIEKVIIMNFIEKEFELFKAYTKAVKETQDILEDFKRTRF